MGYTSSSFAGQEAFIWDAANGMRELESVLVDLGLDSAVSGWTLTEATGISDDGQTIVGRGINPSGNPEGWIARLSGSPIPEPGTASLLGVACSRSRRCGEGAYPRAAHERGARSR